MFQVTFPMKSGTNLPQLKAIMPIGWILEQSEDNLEKFHVVDVFSSCAVGNLFVREKKVVFRVNEETVNGKKFWNDFGKRYPELNPFIPRFGVLFRSDLQENVFVLDDFSERLPQEIVDAIAHYSKYTVSYCVSFLLGDWHAGEDVLTQTCQEIFMNGELGPVRKMVLFHLGSIENEMTM
ncbi:MAG TPA: hypothetical protein VLH94_01020 [Spirochaetia bacterium]|nr:hypothetical protein [Spirochaetia bacterium]